MQRHFGLDFGHVQRRRFDLEQLRARPVVPRRDRRNLGRRQRRCASGHLERQRSRLGQLELQRSRVGQIEPGRLRGRREGKRIAAVLRQIERQGPLRAGIERQGNAAGLQGGDRLRRRLVRRRPCFDGSGINGCAAGKSKGEVFPAGGNSNAARAGYETPGPRAIGERPASLAPWASSAQRGPSGPRDGPAPAAGETPAARIRPPAAQPDGQCPGAAEIAATEPRRYVAGARIVPPARRELRNHELAPAVRAPARLSRLRRLALQHVAQGTEELQCHKVIFFPVLKRSRAAASASSPRQFLRQGLPKGIERLRDHPDPATTGMKLVSPVQRGTICQWRWSAAPCPPFVPSSILH